jgi:competence protein ComEC
VRAPAAIPACGLAAGAAAGTLLPLPIGPLAVLLIGAWAASVIAVAARRGTAVAVATACGFASAAALMAHQASANAIDPSVKRLFVERIEGRPRTSPPVIVGRLLQDASLTDYGASLDLLVERLVLDGRPIEANGHVRLGVGGSLAGESLSQWRAGRRLQMPVTLRRPVSYLNPGGADQETALALRGVALLGSVKSAALVETLQRGNPVQEGCAAAREWVRDVLARDVGRWSSSSAAIATAILIGDRAGLGSDLEDRLRKAGTYHVIAISGGNIAVLAAVMLFLLRLNGRSPAAGSAAAILVVIAYGLVVSGGQSVARATLAAAIFFTARILDHRAAALNLLLITATLLLVWNPLSVLDAGFELTFGATLGILVAAHPISCGVRHGLVSAGVPVAIVDRLRPLLTLLSATVAAELALMPIGASMFFLVTFAGLFVNFLAIPLMSVVQIGAMLTLLLSAAAPLGVIPSSVVHLSASALVESTRLVDWAPWLVRRVPPPAVAVVVLYYVGSVIGIRSASRCSKQLGAVLAGAAGISMLIVPVSLWISQTVPASGPFGTVYAPALAAERLRVTFLDVAQGDATLVQFPGGRALLVDAGGASGSFDVGSRVVAPALWALGVERLDFLLLTHGDLDHVGGAAALIRDFRPREVWDGVRVPRNVLMERIAEAAGRNSATYRQRLAGDFMRIGGASVHIVNPPPPDWERQAVRNDDSVVLEIRFGEISVVLPGDIGRDVELVIADRFEPARIRVLKAPHHGSRSSSSKDFLESVRPAAVVFSAGRSNLFGHPAPDVVARYRQASAAVFRTDQDGAVVLETDGKVLTITTARGRRIRFQVPGSGF